MFQGQERPYATPQPQARDKQPVQEAQRSQAEAITEGQLRARRQERQLLLHMTEAVQARAEAAQATLQAHRQEAHLHRHTAAAAQATRQARQAEVPADTAVEADIAEAAAAAADHAAAVAEEPQEDRK